MKRTSILLKGKPGLMGLLRWQPVVAGMAWLMLLAFVPLLSGCQSYYRSQEKSLGQDEVRLLADSKRFVLHQGDEVWELRSPSLKNEKLSGNKEALSVPISKYKKSPAKGRSAPYFKKDEPVVLNIVHVYINSFEQGENGRVSIPLSAISRIDLIEKDTGKTHASYVLGGIGAGVGVIVLLYIIVLLTKSSCPFVYAHDGREYRFVGEAYGGAIFAPAERNDYLPLPTIQPEGNEYRVKISNELKERQYTNLAELWVVQHPAATKVLLDQQGHVQTLARPLTPTAARSQAGTDYTAQLQATDRNVFLFNEDTPGGAPNTLEMSLAKPTGARHGKLVLHAQNSLWLDYLYGAFIEKFGTYYNTWATQQQTLPTAVNQQWGLDQHIPLKVYVEAGQGWQLVETIPTVGPLASRDLVVPLDFAANTTGQVRVKLECGFMFWEVDYAALDCSPNAAVQLDNCRLTSARTERGADASAQLAADDTQYLRQLRPGTVVSLAYETKLPEPGAKARRSVFLRTKGYYEHIREFEGLPNVPALYAFKKPGRFVEFSKERYRQTVQELNPATASR